MHSGNIQNLKETSSLHLYICNSESPPRPSKKGCLCPTNSCFVYARFFLISAFKQILLKRLKRQLLLGVTCAGVTCIFSCVFPKNHDQITKTKVVSIMKSVPNKIVLQDYLQGPCVLFNSPSIHFALKRPQKQQKTNFVLEKIHCSFKRIM